MSQLNDPQEIVGAAKIAGASFNNTYAQAPAQVQYQGRIYNRDSAGSPEAKVWYLAAAAMQDPNRIAQLSPTRGLGFDGYSLDADPTPVRNAETVLRKVQSDLRSLTSQFHDADRQLVRAQGERDKCNYVGVGSIFTLGASNAICTLQWDGQIRHWTDKKLEIAAAIEGKQAEEQSAKIELSEAKRAYDEENQRIRAEEERQRQEDLARKAAEAQARNDAAAQAQYQAAQEQAAQDAAWRQQQAEARARQNSVPQPDYSAEDYLGDDYSEESEWLDLADTLGDEDAAAECKNEAAAFDAEIESAYSFDAYYCDCDGIRREEMAEEMYGVDPIIITAIIAGILAIAPVLIALLMPSAPPPQGSTAVNQTALAGGDNAVPPSLAQTVVDKVGLQSVLDNQSAKVGQAAKPDMLIPALIIGGALYLAIRR